MPSKHLTKQEFIDEVFDYEKNEEWKYKGKLPAIIDFYADWCGPCKSVTSTLDQLADEYDNRVDI